MNIDPKITEAAKARIKLRTRYETANRKAQALKAELDELDESLRETIVGAKLEGVRIGGYNFTPSNRDIVELYDDAAFFDYVRRKNAFDLVRRQVVMEAARERWKQGLDIPGARPGKVPTLSVTKAKQIKGAK